LAQALLHLVSVFGGVLRPFLPLGQTHLAR